MKEVSLRIAVIAISLLALPTGQANEWSIPVAGNAFRTAPLPGGDGMRRSGSLALRAGDEVHSVFFRVDRAAKLDLSVTARAAQAGSTRMVAGFGEQTFATPVEASSWSRLPLGQISVEEPGYVRIDLRVEAEHESPSVEVRELQVSSEAESLSLDYVKNNDGNMFYWGRRGPSVHLRYEVPREVPLRYAYSEITVPPGMDPIGSFYMANGFGEGYFGIQVNGPEERRVLFSVWSPFRTDNPQEIPEDQRVVALAKGGEVRVGEFGNEGSGGQSFLVYPWQAGATYRFLTEIVPDGNGNTTYTSWFGDQASGQWRLIASFRRPMTDTHLKGFHSFLESFSPNHGHLQRRAFYGNVWVRSVDGVWSECDRARFSVDATGAGRHRLDFTGGHEGGRFFLQNCGFFNQSGRAGEVFQRDSSGQGPPEIELDQLPRD